MTAAERTHPVTHSTMSCMEIWGGNTAADRCVATPGLGISVFSQPYQQADGGGDVHYVSLCGGGLITRFILADVSGHGASAAEMAQSLRDLMRRNINRKSQARLVKQLNEQFGELARLRRFATAVVATYLADREELTICNAGHPRPIWYRAKSREWHLVRTDEPSDRTRLANLPLGIDDSSIYPQAKLSLDAGDLVLIYTDALIEAVGPDGQMLGEAGLLQLLRGWEASASDRLALMLKEELERFRGGQPAEDDVTFMLIHHDASGPRRLSIPEKLDVYAKVFGLRAI